MTSGRGPRKRPRASARQLRQRYDKLSQYLSTGAAQRMAPHMPLNSPRTKRIMRIMKRRVDERYEQLIGESTWDPEGGGDVLGAPGPGAYIHRRYGVIDYQVAIGHGVLCNAGGQVRIGSASHYLTYDASSGGAVTITSDRRVKKDENVKIHSFVSVPSPTNPWSENSYPNGHVTKRSS